MSPTPSSHRPPARRRLALAAALLLVGGLAACGDDGSTDAASTTTRAAGGDDAPAVESDAFPVTIEHAFGSTEVESEPQRVVSVGYTEQDALLALGVIPVGITDWYGDQPFGTWPWAQDLLGDAEPELLSIADGFELERIARLDPDLIIGTNAGIEADTYEDLAAIAPTIAHPDGGDGYFSAWDTQTLMIGKAVGRGDAAQELVDEVKAEYAAVAEEHPEWEGVKATFLQNAFYEGEAIAYQDGLSTDFLTDLGFEIPSELDAFEGEEDGSQAYIPLEQLSVLDASDVLIWGTEKPSDRDALEEQPLYDALEEVEDGKLVFTDGITAGAIYFTSVLSLPYVLEHLVPALESTLAGDGPATIE